MLFPLTFSRIDVAALVVVVVALVVALLALFVTLVLPARTRERRTREDRLPPVALPDTRVLEEAHAGKATPPTERTNRENSGGAASMSTFILTVAGTVLANVITELIIGRLPIARREEIESRVAVVLRDRSTNVQALQPAIVSEVFTIASQDTQLKVSDAAVVLKSPPKAAQSELDAHLVILRGLIEQRRRDLGLPLAESDVPHADDLEDASTGAAKVTWIAPAPSLRSDELKRAQLEREQQMVLDRIRRRRAGEKLTND